MKKTIAAHPWITLLGFLWLLVIVTHTQFPQLIVDSGAFLLLGVVGAIFANATGAGGGVVFVPFFQQLEFTPQMSVATSFAIQCCGMTAGALSWLQYYRLTQTGNPDWRPLMTVLKITIPIGWLGIWLVQFGFERWLPALGFTHFASQLHLSFGVFSIFLAIAILATLRRLNSTVHTQDLTGADKSALALISLAGGIITAYLSVGIGELVAVYLIIRRCSVTMAIGAAVILSASAVWAGSVHHLLVTHAINWSVVLFAGAGAVIGGRLARYLVLLFPAHQIKLFFAVWVLILGILSIV
ncbi:sulfite exporter TauE/SafE family protein [Alteromonas gilva]|uniref:Probable membrane transporter protein n=1 Tax=Alteromonas gilva TaxID=2987522 RepID=A0ABT5L0M9_9ALTE|nr:sulfite exporter TauE/SafE family protein [Alteromonas gilva]MDC8830579.1 sulfite exporter TauE/SafE family protein [Alteromonas gilva]